MDAFQVELFIRGLGARAGGLRWRHTGVVLVLFAVGNFTRDALFLKWVFMVRHLKHRQKLKTDNVDAQMRCSKSLQ